MAALLSGGVGCVVWWYMCGVCVLCEWFCGCVCVGREEVLCVVLYVVCVCLCVCVCTCVWSDLVCVVLEWLCVECVWCVWSDLVCVVMVWSEVEETVCCSIGVVCLWKERVCSGGGCGCEHCVFVWSVVCVGCVL